jgi:hypothetical protein
MGKGLALTDFGSESAHHSLRDEAVSKVIVGRSADELGVGMRDMGSCMFLTSWTTYRLLSVSLILSICLGRERAATYL